MTERLWCEVCGHGVDGYIGKTCPECMTKRRGDNCGVLKTPEEAEREYLERSKAIKLARASENIRGQKTTAERLAEMKKSILDEIRQEFNLVPKSQAVEESVKPAVETVEQDTPKTVAEYRASKKSTKTKK